MPAATRSAHHGQTNAGASDRFRVDAGRDHDGNAAVLELEAIDPLLYLAECSTATAAFADAVRTG